MGSLRKIRPVVQGWALLASPVSPEVALFLFLKGCPYLEHSQGGGWPGRCRPGRTWGCGQAAGPPVLRLFRSTRRHGAEVSFAAGEVTSWAVTSYLPPAWGQLLASWAPLFASVYCVPETGRLSRRRGQDSGGDNAPIVPGTVRVCADCLQKQRSIKPACSEYPQHHVLPGVSLGNEGVGRASLAVSVAKDCLSQSQTLTAGWKGLQYP